MRNHKSRKGSRIEGLHDTEDGSNGDTARGTSGLAGQFAGSASCPRESVGAERLGDVDGGTDLSSAAKVNDGLAVVSVSRAEISASEGQGEDAGCKGGKKRGRKKEENIRAARKITALGRIVLPEL